MRFWNRTEGSELEDRLQSERPAPRPEFLRAVASRVDARRVRTSLRLRVAFASGLTLAMFVAVASVGAVSYAASGAQKAVQSVGHVLSSTSKGTQASSNNNNDDDDDDDDADEDEYDKPCKDAVKQEIKAEKEFHKQEMRKANNNPNANTRRYLKKKEDERHQAALKVLNKRKKDCEKNGS